MPLSQPGDRRRTGRLPRWLESRRGLSGALMSMASIAALTTGIEIGGIAGAVGAAMVMGGIAGGGAESSGVGMIGALGAVIFGTVIAGASGPWTKAAAASCSATTAAWLSRWWRRRQSSKRPDTLPASVVFARHATAGQRARRVSSSTPRSSRPPPSSTRLTTAPRPRRPPPNPELASGRRGSGAARANFDSVRRRRHLRNGHRRGRDDGPLDLRPGARHLDRSRRARISNRRDRSDRCDDAGSHRKPRGVCTG